MRSSMVGVLGVMAGLSSLVVGCDGESLPSTETQVEVSAPAICGGSLFCNSQTYAPAVGEPGEPTITTDRRTYRADDPVAHVVGGFVGMLSYVQNPANEISVRLLRGATLVGAATIGGGPNKNVRYTLYLDVAQLQPDTYTLVAELRDAAGGGGGQTVYATASTTFVRTSTVLPTSTFPAAGVTLNVAGAPATTSNARWPVPRAT